ncbi:MAG: C-terminal helicase domain-containing protein, partial [Candidatus Cybelea sp.]
PRLVKLPAARNVCDSSKLEALLEMLPELIDEGRRVLLFSQFTSMLDLIKPELAARAIDYVEIRGETKNRETPVRRFQNREVPLFLISLKAGGTGLNLTAADTVIHYDPWWNPAVERQATDRAHRIGQHRPVFVYKLITVGTVEERILELQQRKGALAASIFDDAAATAQMLDETEIERLLAPPL